MDGLVYIRMLFLAIKWHDSHEKCPKCVTLTLTCQFANKIDFYLFNECFIAFMLRKLKQHLRWVRN